jgi:membrane protein
VAGHVVDKHPIIECLGGRPRASVAKPHTGNVVRRFFVHLYHELVNDSITDIGAMMAYYAILALFPMLVFVVTLALMVLPDDTVLQGLAMATQAMPPAPREVLTTQVTTLMKAAHTGFAIGSFAVALWGASRGASSLMGALNAMFNKRETRPWWRRQIIAIVVTLGVAIVIVLALGLLVVGPVAGHWLADRFGLTAAFDTAWGIGRWVGAGLLVMVVWAVAYRFLPNTSAPFRIFTPGAITGVLLWLGISYVFGLYLGYVQSYTTTYGALGGGIIFLTWLWLSNIALLFGAEINDVLADLRKHRSPAAAVLAAETHPTEPDAPAAALPPEVVERAAESAAVERKAVADGAPPAPAPAEQDKPASTDEPASGA